VGKCARRGCSLLVGLKQSIHRKLEVTSRSKRQTNEHKQINYSNKTEKPPTSDEMLTAVSVLRCDQDGPESGQSGACPDQSVTLLFFDVK
jgi:hypothetical protein